MYLLFIIIATLGTALLPYIVKAVGRYKPHLKLSTASFWLPLSAALLFYFSFYLPDIGITSETSTFQQHFVGGGIYSAILFVYFKQLFGWRVSLITSFILLSAWVSTFGAANELFEFALVQLGLSSINLDDTSWDLVANSSGALIGYALLLLLRVDKINNVVRRIK